MDRFIGQCFAANCIDNNATKMLICSYFPNGCEVDITIKEDFPEEKLVEFIDAFAEVNCQLPLMYIVQRK